MTKLKWHYERKKGPHYYDTRGALIATVPGGRYRVDGYTYNWQADFQARVGGGPVGGAFRRGRHSTQAEAKQACQEHHDRRLKEVG